MNNTNEIKLFSDPEGQKGTIYLIWAKDQILSSPWDPGRDAQDTQEAEVCPILCSLICGIITFSAQFRGAYQQSLKTTSHKNCKNQASIGVRRQREGSKERSLAPLCHLAGVARGRTRAESQEQLASSNSYTDPSPPRKSNTIQKQCVRKDLGLSGTASKKGQDGSVWSQPQ